MAYIFENVCTIHVMRFRKQHGKRVLLICQYIIILYCSRHASQLLQYNSLCY